MCTTLEGYKIMKDFEKVINKYALDAACNTPDYILARHLYNCLFNYRDTIQEKERFFEKKVPKEG